MSKPGIPFVSALWKSLASFFQYNIGLMCERGGGGSEDPARAAEWYGKAAGNGHARAQFSLGLMYYNGQGVERDLAAARRMWEQAAEQGHSLAQYNLGVMYNNGEGVWRDLGKAREWYGKACKNGLQQGCEKLRELTRFRA